MDFNPGLGGVSDVASAISSNEHSIKLSLLFSNFGSLHFQIILNSFLAICPTHFFSGETTSKEIECLHFQIILYSFLAIWPKNCIKLYILSLEICTSYFSHSKVCKLCVFSVRSFPEKNVGVFDDTFILPPQHMRFNYFDPPTIKSNYVNPITHITHFFSGEPTSKEI